MIAFKTMDFPKKITILLLCLLIFLRPFISSKAFPEIEGYYLFFLIITSIIFIKKIKFEKNSETLNFSFFFLTLAGILSLLFSPNKPQSLISFPDHFTGILFFLITLSLNVRETKTILKIILLSGFLISLYGIHQYLFGFSMTAKYILDENPNLFINHLVRNYLLSQRVFATFFSPNILAGYLIVIIPVALGYILEFMGGKKIIPYIAAFVLCLALLLTKSLGAILSLAFSLILFSLLLKSKRKLSLKVLSLGLIVTLLLVTLIITPIILARADRLFNFQNPHNSIMQRANFLRLTLKIIKEYPLWGVGMGNFGDFYMRYRGTWDIRTNYAHNFILQIQAEMGILGSLGLGILLFVFTQDILSYIKKTKENYRFLKTGLLCAGVSFLLHNLIDISFFIPEVAVFFWIAWAGFKNLTE